LVWCWSPLISQGSAMLLFLDSTGLRCFYKVMVRDTIPPSGVMRPRFLVPIVHRAVRNRREDRTCDLSGVPLVATWLAIAPFAQLRRNGSCASSVEPIPMKS